ncbi:anti-sigma factor antagonist [Pseudoduganella sp. FT93W]|uniref:Anti-sigma factor antagonist n=1 Tax=Duganella fentianensis TaxID=2692177 RepID=A0A845HR89_9BURK|nr:STAS domain-containing protein [Duganella fentianensis]MYN43964.1 anti-sigma factor antagonist [Duganella fentianensis]
MSFQYDFSQLDGATAVRLSGRLDSATASGFEKPLQDLFNQPASRVLMDFSALDYISSAGLRVVLMAAKRAKQSQGALVLCSLQQQVRDVFEISGFLRILDVADDSSAALNQLRART